MTFKKLLAVLMAFQLLVATTMSGQVLDESTFNPPRTFKDNFKFEINFLQPGFDKSKIDYVMTVREKQRLSHLAFTEILVSAKDYRCNVIEIVDFSFDEKRNKEAITFKLYYANKEQLNENAKLFQAQQNIVNFYSSIYNDNEIIINGQKKKLQSSSWYSFKLLPNQVNTIEIPSRKIYLELDGNKIYDEFHIDLEPNKKNPYRYKVRLSEGNTKVISLQPMFGRFLQKIRPLREFHG